MAMKDLVWPEHTLYLVFTTGIPEEPKKGFRKNNLLIKIILNQRILEKMRSRGTSELSRQSLGARRSH